VSWIIGAMLVVGGGAGFVLFAQTEAACATADRAQEAARKARETNIRLEAQVEYMSARVDEIRLDVKKLLEHGD